MLNPSTSSRPTRVAWVVPLLARSFYFQPVLKEFAERFPDTRLFTGFWPGFLRGYDKAFQIEFLKGVRFVNLKPDPMGYGRGFIWAPPNILRKLLSYRPDVVIVGGFNLWALYAAIMKVFLGYRLVLFWDGNSPGTVFDGGGLRAWIRGLFGRMVDACISNTQPGADYLESNVGIPANRIIQAAFQVPAADVLSMEPVDLSALRGSKRPMFLYVGRLLKGKGIHKLLEACGLLRQQGHREFSLVLVGDGPDAEALKKQAIDLGLEGQVHWMGGRAYEQLGSFYQACDVFVLASLEDCRPMVVSEAMAFGKAILCSKYTDLTEIVLHGENGYVFDAQKPEELAGYMARFLEQPELIDSYGARSLEIIAPYNPVQAAESIREAVLLALSSGSEALEARA